MMTRFTVVVVGGNKQQQCVKAVKWLFRVWSSASVMASSFCDL
jgi:hypothetical protein